VRSSGRRINRGASPLIAPVLNGASGFRELVGGRLKIFFGTRHDDFARRR
jgi:hypothetical protein